MSETTARRVSADEIPVIDIGPLVDGSDEATVARDLVWAATEVGFIYVRNHGIDEAIIEPLPIAVPSFQAETAEAAQLAGDIARVVAADLTGTGLFREIPSSAFISTVSDFNAPAR